MKIYRTAVFLLLALLASGIDMVSAGIQPLQDCNNIEVRVETTDSKNGLDNGAVVITIIRGQENNAKFIFCEQAGKVLNEGKFETNRIETLKRGEYFCIVSTSGCSKKVTFSIN